MARALCIIGLVVSILLLLIFGLDMAIEQPFGGTNKWVMDLPMIICSVLLALVSWITMRELK